MQPTTGGTVGSTTQNEFRRGDQALEDDGWYEVKLTSGSSHRQFKHATKKGRVTVKHPAKDFPIGTLKSIERQSGVKLR